MIWTVIGLNLGLSIFCLWLVGRVLRLRHRLRKTNLALQMALQHTQALPSAPIWYLEQQIGILNLQSLVVGYRTRGQQLRNLYLLFLLIYQILPPHYLGNFYPNRKHRPNRHRRNTLPSKVWLWF